MSKQQPFFAVRVAVKHDDGSISTRDYVRGNWRIGKDRFTSFALGDMLTLVSRPHEVVRWHAFEVDFTTVQMNRQYQHTTYPEFHN